MKILKFLMALMLCSYGMAQSNISNERIRSTKDVLRSTIANRYGAVVTIELGSDKILKERFGHTDASKRSKITAHTFFHVGSITKSVTALAIMQLVEEGRIRLDDHLGKFFKDIPSPKSSITIKDLLQHTSGLRQTYVTDDIQDFDTAKNAMLNDSLFYQPRQSWSYSNSNYSLLAMIVEKVANCSYEYYVRNNVLLPLNMRETYFWGEIDDTNASYFAQKTYEPSALSKQRNWGYTGCGGMISTQADLKRFAHEVLYKKKLLKKETYDQIFSDTFKIRDGLSMGLGWFVSTDEKGAVEYWSRGSNDFGHNAVIRYFPKKELLVMVLTNSGEADGNPRATGNRILSDLILEQLDRE